MPVGSLRFIRERSYSLRASLGLAIGGIPGVLLAAYIVKSLPLVTVRWLVIVVVLYTGDHDALLGLLGRAHELERGARGRRLTRRSAGAPQGRECDSFPLRRVAGDRGDRRFSPPSSPFNGRR